MTARARPLMPLPVQNLQTEERHSFFNSLSFRMGLIITLTELVLLTGIGVIYSTTFSNELDSRIQANALLPITLVRQGVLEFTDLTNVTEMENLTGEEVVNAFIVGINDNIFFSANPELLGTAFSDFVSVYGLETFNLFELQGPVVDLDTGGNIISAAPIVGEDGRSIRFFAFLEISTAAAQAQKNQIVQTFVLGTVVTLVVTSLVIFLLFNVTIFNRIRNTLQVLDQVASGNLMVSIASPTRDELGALQRGTNTMIARLRESFETLEHRVKERTHDLEVSADVSRQIATLLSRQELLEDLVDRAVSAFGFYQASIFIYEPEADQLKLIAASGEVGRQMIATGKSFELQSQGLVPTAARLRQATVSNDVTETPEHLPNIYLPDTRAEAALPIIFKGEVLGVLDLQSVQLNRFASGDIQLFSAFADQIAVALRNVSLFEQAEIARANAEQADKAKSAFLASTSHELRTPLNAIINLTSFVKRGMMGPTTPRQEEILGLVMQSGQNLLSLINDVLDMSKIESGSLKLYFEQEINILPVLEHACYTARSLLQDKPIVLRTEIPDVLPALTVDKHRFQQILLNILSNACKFTEEGEILLRLEIFNDALLTTISDTGVGIATDDLPRVFEKFAQTESGLRQGGGTGLGMPITKNLVEAHNGRIWLESEPGVGTTFYFTIPLPHPTEAKPVYQSNMILETTGATAS